MTVTFKITGSMKGARVTRSPSPLQQTFEQTNEVANDLTVLVSTAEQDLTLGDLTNPKHLMLRNASTSTDALITFGPKSSSGALITLGGLPFASEDKITIASSDVVVRVKASTANTPLDTRMWDA